jgi:cellobiose dehydrogenase (acceptor)
MHFFPCFQLLGLLALSSTIWGQQTTPFTDSATNITFQRYTDSTSGFAFDIALPTSPTSDFIGQISAPITGGYAAVSLGGPMANRLLLVAWPSGSSVLSSIRVATGYTNPEASTNSSISIKPISSGVSVDDTSFTYTFLCRGCITGDSLTFSSSADSTTFGWALSTTAVTSPDTTTSALNYHGGGFGLFGADLTSARSDSFATWAALASDATVPDTGAGIGNGTTPTNITTSISNATYDYIIVGAGAAGLIVAQRLAESNASVLLLERGGSSVVATGGQAVMSWNSSITQYDVPGMAYYLSTAADTSAYCTDTASQAGCILGGSTMVNAMMWVKPRAADFNSKWPAGWKWSDGVDTAAERLYERIPGTTLASADGQRYDQGAWDILAPWLASNGFSEVNALEDPESKEAVFTRPPWLVCFDFIYFI